MSMRKFSKKLLSKTSQNEKINLFFFSGYVVLFYAISMSVRPLRDGWDAHLQAGAYKKLLWLCRNCSQQGTALAD